MPEFDTLEGDSTILGSLLIAFGLFAFLILGSIMGGF